MIEIEYRRDLAVAYARKWALSPNPDFYHYGGIGGDCTNFASQCVYAGTGIMNYTRDFGWYYIDPNDKAPAWTGVQYFWNFMTTNEGIGPFGRQTNIRGLEPGDIVQLSFDGVRFAHTLVVVAANNARSTRQVFVSAHSSAADNRRLSTYRFRRIRYLHILAARA